MKNLTERDRKNIWHPYTSLISKENIIPIVKGEGVYLIDENGKRYIDAISSWWVNLHGHAHPYIAEKLGEQLRILEHIIFAGFTHPKAVELAERLLQHLPTNQKKIFYSDNGSTAVEVALKMALQYWYNQNINKTKIIAFEGSYHGDTFGAMSVSSRGPFTKAFSPFLFDVLTIALPLKGKEEKVLKQFKVLAQTGNIAAFIFEPLIQGTGGMRIYSSEVLNEMLKLCKENNIITIADEVMTGFGRTAKFFATDYIEEQADIYCLSKGLTGGTMALGVTSCSQEIHKAFLSEDKFKTLFHGHSFTANPLACTAALASLDLLEKEQCWKNISWIEQKHKSFSEEIKKNKQVKDVRCLGTIIAIELNSEDSTSYFSSLRDVAYSFFIDRNIIIRPLGNVIYVMPPYCINDKEITDIYAAITDFLEYLAKQDLLNSSRR